MMIPKDVEGRTFSTVRFHGYDMEEVNRFLDELAADYAALFQENTALKGKMKFLIGKMNELQAAQKEEQTPYANAREAADKLIASARAERDALLAEAKLEADRIRFDAMQEAEQAESQIGLAQQKIVGFSDGMKKLIAMQKATLDRKSAEMQGLFAQEQGFLDEQLAFLSKLEQHRPVSPESKPEEPPKPSRPAPPIPLDPTEPFIPATPHPADEQSCVVELSHADDKDYQF